MHKNQPTLTDMDGVDRYFLHGLHIPYPVKIEIPNRKKKKPNIMAGQWIKCVLLTQLKTQNKILTPPNPPAEGISLA